jgi:hypothetical protein
MKKFASLVGAGVVFFSLAGGVMAVTPQEESVLVVNKGGAFQTVGSVAVANSGLNDIEAGKTSGMIKQNATITTGAASALSSTQAIANQFVTTVKVVDNSFSMNAMLMPDFSGGIKVINDSGMVFQKVGSLALASSGLNDIEAGKNGGGIKQIATIKTGAATSISETQAWANIFNTKITSMSSDVSISRFPHPCN